MKKVLYFILFVTLLLQVGGCNTTTPLENTEGSSKESTSEKESGRVSVRVEKEVVFSNEDYFGIPMVPEDERQSVTNVKNYAHEEAVLYACYVYCIGTPDNPEPLPKLDGESDEDYAVRVRTHEIEYVVDVMRSKGFMILEDYPFCYYNHEELYDVNVQCIQDNAPMVLGDCVIVGTYKQINDVFNGDTIIQGCELHAIRAPRSDYMELIRECGYTGEEPTGSPVEWAMSYLEDVKELVGGDYSIMTVSLLMPEET